MIAAAAFAFFAVVSTTSLAQTPNPPTPAPTPPPLFATTKVAATFRLAYVVFNTIANLTTQDAQVQCFENVAAHLDPGGCFVVEIGVPELQRLPPGETVRAFTVSSTRLGFDEYDIANQGLVSHHYRMVDGRADEWSVPFRYVWPAELDLMARLAGMTLRERWSSWTREPFTSDSTKHISVWEKANVTTRSARRQGRASSSAPMRRWGRARPRQRRRRWSRCRLRRPLRRRERA